MGAGESPSAIIRTLRVNALSAALALLVLCDVTMKIELIAFSVMVLMHFHWILNNGAAHKAKARVSWYSLAVTLTLLIHFPVFDAICLCICMSNTVSTFGPDQPSREDVLKFVKARLREKILAQ